MPTHETRFDIGDVVYRTDDSLFQDAKQVTAILIDKEKGAYYYLNGCNNYAESSLRTKEEQIVAIQARVVKFIQGEK